jgi:predicted membrane GTPase involved in stress response
MALGAKTGGRVKGTLNKRTTDIQEMLAAVGCNPIMGLAAIAQDESHDISIRLSAYKELAQYVASKRKAVELNASLSLSHEEALAYLEADD